MGLSRRKEIVGKIETTPGSLVSGLWDAANAKELVLNPRADFEVSMFDRQYLRSTLTPIPSLAGIKTGTIGFQVELAGHAHATPDLPTWDKYLRACGFKSVATNKVAFTGATGTLRHGETVTATGTGASGTAIVVHDTWPSAAGAGTIYLESDSITWATSGVTTLTGGSTADTVTVGADVESSDAGQSWYPVSQPTVLITDGAVTGTLEVDDILVMSNASVDLQISGVITSISGTTMRVRMGTGFPAATSGYLFHVAGESATAPSNYYTMTSATVVQDDVPTLGIGLNEDGIAKTVIGARGTVSLEARIGEPALLTFEFTGAAYAGEDRSMLSGVVTETKVPPVFLGAAIAIADETGAADPSLISERTPCITALSLAMNNTVALRQCAAATSGIKFAEISERAPTGSMDPEQEPEATFPLIAKFLAGSVMRLRSTIGSVAANQFLLSMPGLQATGLPSGDRNGIATRELAFKATGGARSNLSDSPGADNEFVLTYLL